MSNPDWDDWVEDGEEDLPTRCLCCTTVVAGTEPMLKHCVEAHGFDLKAVIKQRGNLLCFTCNCSCSSPGFFLSRLGYDFYQSIKLVNFIRGQTVAQPLKESEKFTLGEVPQFVEGDEQYLQPIIPEDPLLMALGNFDDEEEGFGGAIVAPAPQGSGLRINQHFLVSRKRCRKGSTLLLFLLFPPWIVQRKNCAVRFRLSSGGFRRLSCRSATIWH